MESISAFEIIKLGIGPSSSHTMGPWHACERFIRVLHDQANLSQVTEITTTLFGSLAKTGKGHGTDIALMLGLSGEHFATMDLDLLDEKIAQIKNEGKLTLNQEHIIPFEYDRHIVFDKDHALPFHPNGLRFSAKLHDGAIVQREYFSIGGGFVVTEANQEIKNNAIITQYPCHSAEDIVANCQKLNLRVSELVFLNEQAWRSTEEIRGLALSLWSEMKNCIFRGVYKNGILPGGLNVRRRAADLNAKRLDNRTFENVDDWIMAIKSGPTDFNTVNKWVSIFAMAVNEENASFGRIITAPTNGASGVLPAVLFYAYCFTPHFSDDKIVDFILTAGEIGSLYKKGATISAAMGGCQAEIGVSSSMAAGALADVLGGTKEQVMQAAEIAMEHHLGMTCDPIAGLVQVPCIERNSMGAIKAITAANIALDESPINAKVSLDNVIKSMWETAQDMNSKYKETSEAGLANISVKVAEC
jgi:L-serine dehydratase